LTPVNLHIKVKSPLEIPLYLVHSGSSRQVVALATCGELPGLDYLGELKQHNPKGYQILYNQFRFICDAPMIRNRDAFKLLDSARRLYEFRTRSGLRLYCFFEGEALVLLTNGGKKNTPKEQNRDIQRAKALQDEFLQLKNQGAILRITTQNED
jgi:hypothetical protein